MDFWLRDRDPFGPVAYRSSRGMIHRARRDGTIHPRCAAGKPLTGDFMSVADAFGWAEGREAALCRYPWCYRAAVRALGLDPEVGHISRSVSVRKVRPPRTPKHRAEPVRPHQLVDSWAWCSCGRILAKMTAAHNPDRSWWWHKAGGRTAA